MSDTINHTTQAISRLLTQYREASNLIAYISAFTDESDQLETMFQDLLNDRWIDTAEGAQLDIIGLIVGQSRVVAAFQANPFFGFLGSIGAGTFGTLADSGIGEVFITLSDTEFETGTLTDAEYRIFIRARIQKNHTNATIEDVITVVNEIVSSTSLYAITEGDATFDIDFDGSLTDTEKLVLTRGELTPRPAGVSVTYQDDIGLFV